MKASASSLRTAPTAPTVRAEAVAILAGAMVAILLAKGPSGRPGAPSPGVKPRHAAKGANGCANG